MAANAEHILPASLRQAANREDTYGSVQRGEDTSVLETRLDAETEQEADGDTEKWFAAGADGSVQVKTGPVSSAKLDAIPRAGDSEIDSLRKLRLAQMKGEAAQRQAWLDVGHGTYAQLKDEAQFLAEIGKHERVVCHLCEAGSIDGELMHRRLEALCRIHLETYFCWLDAENAPMMLAMVRLEGLPALLIARGGKVAEQLANLDRSFTIEGVAYELGQRAALFFEEGKDYTKMHKARGGCSATTAVASGRRADSDDSDEDADLSD
jgi:hypothetical protein